MYFLNRTPSLCGFLKRICLKHMYWTQKNIHIEHLKHRCILRIHGPDANSYLQGILTNNMNVNESMKSEQFCIYSLILNPHGRVLYDCLVYKTSEKDDYLLEHDAAALQFIKIHLDMYRLRRQVKVEHVQNAAVWVAFRCEKCVGDKHNNSLETFSSSDAVKKDLIACATDPRVSELGQRFVMSENNSSFQNLIQDEHELPVSYDLLRYKLGIGEGVADHPPGGCLPFEINADFLNGISFDKGCYVGQELTARTYHTGVVRKRITPVKLCLKSDSSPSFPAECAVLNSKKQKMGKLRNHIGRYGLAVLNVEEIMKGDLILEGSGVHLSASKPKWWPMLKNVTT